MTKERWATRSGTFFTHNLLWSDLQHVWKLVGPPEDTDHGIYTAALVLLYACFEAHLNYLGDALYPEIWAVERDQLSGTFDKWHFLASELRVPIDKGRRPYSTIKELARRRHQLVHPRTERRSHRAKFTDPRQLTNLQTEYYDIATPRFLSSALTAVEEASNALQKAAFALRPGGHILGPHAFSGLTSFGSGSIET